MSEMRRPRFPGLRHRHAEGGGLHKETAPEKTDQPFRRRYTARLQKSRGPVSARFCQRQGQRAGRNQNSTAGSRRRKYTTGRFSGRRFRYVRSRFPFGGKDFPFRLLRHEDGGAVGRSLRTDKRTG